MVCGIVNEHNSRLSCLRLIVERERERERERRAGVGSSRSVARVVVCSLFFGR